MKTCSKAPALLELNKMKSQSWLVFDKWFNAFKNQKKQESLSHTQAKNSK
jgi:hypothetical protein